MKLYRYTAGDTGIYEARLRALKSEEERQKLLDVLRSSWKLPYPGDLSKLPPTQSYFTPLGMIMYKHRHAKYLSGTNSDEQMQLQTTDRDKLDGEIIYEDPYQVIVLPK